MIPHRIARQQEQLLVDIRGPPQKIIIVAAHEGGEVDAEGLFSPATGRMELVQVLMPLNEPMTCCSLGLLLNSLR